MSKIYLRHDLSDQHLGKAEIKSLNNDGKPDHIDIPVNFGNLKRAITMTTSDVIAMAEALGFSIEKRGLQFLNTNTENGICPPPCQKTATYKATGDPRLMEDKVDIISSSVGEDGITTVKIKRDEE